MFSRYFRAAQRLVYWLGAASLVVESWRAVEQWYFSNYGSESDDSSRIETSIRHLAIASNILEAGGLPLIVSLYKRQLIPGSVLVKAFLIEAIQNPVVPITASKSQMFRSTFNDEVPIAYPDQDWKGRAESAVVRELTVRNISNFFNGS